MKKRVCARLPPYSSPTTTGEDALLDPGDARDGGRVTRKPVEHERPIRRRGLRLGRATT